MGGIVATRVHAQPERIPSLGPGFLDMHHAAIRARHGEKTLRFRPQAGGEYDLQADAGLDDMQTFAVEAGAQVIVRTKGKRGAADDAEIFGIGCSSKQDIVIRDYGFHVDLLRIAQGSWQVYAWLPLNRRTAAVTQPICSSLDQALDVQRAMASKPVLAAMVLPAI